MKPTKEVQENQNTEDRRVVKNMMYGSLVIEDLESSSVGAIVGVVLSEGRAESFDDQHAELEV